MKEPYRKGIANHGVTWGEYERGWRIDSLTYTATFTAAPSPGGEILRGIAKLRGKLNIYCGDMDNFYLKNAVHLVEELLNSKDYGGEVTYGDRAEHCWNDDPTRPKHLSRLRYHQMFIPKMVGRILLSAPDGADLANWRY